MEVEIEQLEEVAAWQAVGSLEPVLRMAKRVETAVEDLGWEVVRQELDPLCELQPALFPSCGCSCYVDYGVQRIDDTSDVSFLRV